MSTVVVDTNVVLVANAAHEAASEECVMECVKRLNALMSTGTVVIDDGYRVLREYQNKIDGTRGKGVGDVFVKWLLQQSGNAARVHQVTITETGTDFFQEFPVAALQSRFDAPDRKFPTVANAHPDKPPIWQAVDCKWLDWWQEMLAAGVRVEFLCPDDICRYYRRKFPRKAEPVLP